MKRYLAGAAAMLCGCLISLPAWGQSGYDSAGGSSPPADQAPSLLSQPEYAPPASPSDNYRYENNAPGGNYSYSAPPPAGSCDCQSSTTVQSYQPLSTLPPAGATVYQSPTTTLRPVVTYYPSPAPVYQPAVSYPSRVTYYPQTYVPPPPVSRVVYQRPVVYGYPPAAAAPAAAATPQPYYLPPLIPVQNVPVGAEIGRGLYGQPTVYVPGQPVRNFVRYLSP